MKLSQLTLASLQQKITSQWHELLQYNETPACTIILCSLWKSQPIIARAMFIKPFFAAVPRNNNNHRSTPDRVKQRKGARMENNKWHLPLHNFNRPTHRVVPYKKSINRKTASWMLRPNAGHHYSLFNHRSSPADIINPMKELSTFTTLCLSLIHI